MACKRDAQARGAARERADAVAEAAATARACGSWGAGGVAWWVGVPGRG
jgi:hypothetical protein